MSYLDKDPATAEDSAFAFYDIESLHNAFTVAVYDRPSHRVSMFCLIDDDGLVSHAALRAGGAEVYRRILEDNPALTAERGAPHVDILDLSTRDNVYALLKLLGGAYEHPNPHTPNPNISRLPAPCIVKSDTAADYDPAHDRFIVGYNSDNYDLVMLALFFHQRLLADPRDIGCEVGPEGNIITAATMRRLNDRLFSDEFRKKMTSFLYRSDGYDNRQAWNLYRSMVDSGRHLDISRLNETQQYIPLKRLLGQMGHQILESSRLSGPDARVDTIGDLVDLVVYNVSDVIGTHLMFSDPVYSSTFNQRVGLMHSYPETVYAAEDPEYRHVPNISPATIHERRLRPTSTSAQFAARILAPYRKLADVPGHLADSPVVSYRYPAAQVAEATGVPRVNVLTASRNFFLENVSDPTALAEFKTIYDYYRQIEGRNFNQNTPPIEEVVAGMLTNLNRLVSENQFFEIEAAGVAHALNRIFPGAIAPEVSTEPAVPFRQLPVNHFTLPELEQNLDNAEKLLAKIGNGQPHHKLLARQIKHVRVFYQAQYDASLPFDPTIAPPMSTWPPQRDGAPETHHDGLTLGDIAKVPSNITYFDAYGRPTGCYVNFSTGGIHGSELDMDAFHADNAIYRRAKDRLIATLDTAIAQVGAALRDGDDKDRRLAEAACRWAEGATDPAIDWSKVPAIARADGFGDYDPIEVARAAWWMRNKLRIQVIDPHTGDAITVEHGDVLAPGRKNVPYWRTDPKGHRPTVLFGAATTKNRPVLPAGSVHRNTNLNGAYAKTSVGKVIHEDFTSYYPLMLTNMAAFDNPDLAIGSGSADRYRDIFNQKEELGAKLKDPSLTPAERNRTKILREGTKLILNSASGAADTRYDNTIQMNNNVAAMRIIGQLFSWRIGQAQTFAGAKIVSTNTDGLYSVLDFETNQAVLDRYADEIGVEIEPETLLLVSKDSNNRVEFHMPDDPDIAPHELKVAGASGGTLVYHNGPNPRKSMTNPPVRDHVLVEYFKYLALGADYTCPNTGETRPLDITGELDRGLVGDILDRLHATSDPKRLLTFYQNLVASSVGSNSYLFSVPHGGLDADGNPIEASDPETLTHPGHQMSDTSGRRTPTLLQHYNRIFYVDPDKVAAHPRLGQPVNIAAAAAATISQTTRDARIKRGEAPAANNPTARWLLQAAGVNIEALAGRVDFTIKRHTNLDPAAPLVIFNESIHHQPDVELLEALIECLDREAYISIIAAAYEHWRNRAPENPDDDADAGNAAAAAA